jgi:hypothetical protein
MSAEQRNKGISEEFRAKLHEREISQADPNSLTSDDEAEYESLAPLADMSLDQIRATSRDELAAWREKHNEYRHQVRQENNEQRRKFAHDIGNRANTFFNVIDLITGTSDESSDERLFHLFQDAAKKLTSPKTTTE